MGEAQGILGHPGTGLFAMLIIGGLAGWIAGMITEFRHGILTNILVGMAGAFIGGKLAEMLDIPVGRLRPASWSARSLAPSSILFIWQRVRTRPTV